MQKIGKEVKIGLAVIGVLVAAFGYILVRRLSRPDDVAPPPASAQASAKNSLNAATTPPSSSDQPTVVSATDNGRLPGSSADSAPPSHSLFTSGRMPAGDSSDTATEQRGSFMPAAKDATPGNETIANSTKISGAAPPNDVAVAGTDRSAEAGHSMFTSHSNAAPPDASTGHSAFGSSAPANDPFRHKSSDSASAATSAPTDSAAKLAPPTPSSSAAVDARPNGKSVADSASPTSAPAPSAGTNGPLAAASPPAASPDTISPATAPQAAITTTGGSTSDPFKQPSQAATTAAPPASSVPAASEQNPLRESRDQLAGSAAGGTNAALPNSSGDPAARTNSTPAPARFSTADVVPPPVTSSAINVPTQDRGQSLDSARTTQPADAAPASGSWPSAGAAPVAEATHKPGPYVVQADDNYWTVSEKVYGTGGYFKAIYEHNRRQHAQSDHLQVGDVLDVPDAATLEQMYPDLCPKSSHVAQAAGASSAAAAQPGTRLYTVADGDTLYEIARRELGRANRWGEIYQLNKDQLGNDFSYLHAGTQLVIPSDSESASLARDPNGAVQR